MAAINIPEFYRRLGDNQDAILDGLDSAHIDTLNRSLRKLERSVVSALQDAPVEGGVLWDTKWAIQFRKQLSEDFGKEYNPWAQKTVDGYNESAKGINSLFGKLNLDSDFTKVDKSAIKQLKQQYFHGFQDLGLKFVNEMADATYQSVLTGRKFEDLVVDLQQSINGVHIVTDESKDLVAFVDKYRDDPAKGEAVAEAIEKLHTQFAQDMVGQNLRRYSSQMVHDSLMQFNGTYTRHKAQEAGLDHYLYYGSLIKDSRSFCSNHVDKTYSTAEAEKIWSNQQWKGKSGTDPFIDRGGFNCRHHFIPVDPEHLAELEGGEVREEEEEPVSKPQARKIKYPSVDSVVAAGMADQRYPHKDGQHVLYADHKIQPKNLLGKVKLDKLEPHAREVVDKAIVDAQDAVVQMGGMPIRAVRAKNLAGRTAASMGEGILSVDSSVVNRYARPLKPEIKAKIQSSGKEFLFAHKRFGELETEINAAIEKGVTGKPLDRLRSKLEQMKRRRAVAKMDTQDLWSTGLNTTKWAADGDREDRAWIGAELFSQPDEQIRALVFHEMGHQLHDSYGGMSYQGLTLGSELVQKARKMDRTFSPTKYADVNEKEWFAENFTLYHMGRKDIVDKGIKKVFDNLTKGVAP